MASIDNGSVLGIEASLFKTADKLRGNMEPSDYKHVAPGPHLPQAHLGRVRTKARGAQAEALSASADV